MNLLFKLMSLALFATPFVCATLFLPEERKIIESLAKRGEAFIQKYEVDPELKNLLDEHHQDIVAHLKYFAKHGLPKSPTVWQFKWLPGYYVKYNLARIDGMERIKKAIKDHNLDLLDVPEKRIYHVKGRPREVSNMNYVVIVKKIERDHHAQPMSKRHAEQMIKLIKESEYVSMSANNYIRTYNGKIVVIDTESTFDKNKFLSRGLMRLISEPHVISKDYTADALKLILAHLAVHIKKLPARSQHSFNHAVKGKLTKAKAQYSRYFEQMLRKSRDEKVSQKMTPLD